MRGAGKGPGDRELVTSEVIHVNIFFKFESCSLSFQYGYN